MDGRLLDLAFKSGSYKGMLDKKAKKDNKQFGNGFIKEMEENLKFGK